MGRAEDLRNPIKLGGENAQVFAGNSAVIQCAPHEITWTLGASLCNSVRSLRLCGETTWENDHHGDTEIAQRITESSQI